jgi:hypothetical protein
MSKKLYYCNTIYGVSPPSDVNPLILQRHSRDKILIFCAREGQLIRLNNKVKNDSQYKNIHLLVCGWWEFQVLGLIDKAIQLNIEELNRWDVFVILNRARIDKVFTPILSLIENFCK